MRVGKQTWWNWVFHHADSACFLIEPSRGKDVVEAFPGGHRPDYWVSDRLAAQMGWAKKEHQVCLAHLLRDVQYAIDAGDSVFEPRLRDLLRKVCAIGRRREELADPTLRAHERTLDDQLDKLLRLTPKAAEGRKLVDMIKRFRQHFFVFVTHRDLPATNNGSERAIRPSVTFRKVQLLPFHMGRKALRRHPLRPRNRATTRHRRAPRNLPNPRRKPREQ